MLSIVTPTDHRGLRGGPHFAALRLDPPYVLILLPNLREAQKRFEERIRLANSRSRTSKIPNRHCILYSFYNRISNEGPARFRLEADQFEMGGENAVLENDQDRLLQCMFLSLR